jgi:hypothetical protein
MRKMILHALWSMIEDYESILILEDDCFPSRDAVEVFRSTLDEVRDNPEIFSVYGHHFGLPEEFPAFTRFQGWGWASSAEKLEAVLPSLSDAFSVSEAEYLAWIERTLTPEIVARLDVTPPRNPTNTLRRFFAWDETLALITAMRGQLHKPTPKRVIFNCGVGEESGHFVDVERHRNPPYNLVLPSEVWEYF